MANAGAAKPEILVELDRPRRMVFDFNALCNFEKVSGQSAFNAETWLKPGASTCRCLLWAGLLTDDKSLTLDKAGDLMDQFPEKAMEAIKFAHEAGIKIAFPKEKKSG